MMHAELLTRLFAPHIETLALAKDMTKPGASSHRLTGALMRLADTVAQSPGSLFDALKRVRGDVSLAQVLHDTAVPELFNAAGVDVGYENWPLSEATVSKGTCLKWDQHWPLMLMPLPPEDDSDWDFSYTWSYEQCIL